MKKIIIILLFILFISCDKICNLQWMKYEQTACADTWGNSNSFSNDKDLEKAVTNNFDEMKIKIKTVNITNDGIIDYCYACNCRTGKIIHCKVKEKDISEMEIKGFKKE